MGRARESIWAMGIAAIALALFWGYGPLDDDYIVYRYAAQWLEWGQLTYNNDQFVEGFTSPLWLFLITAAMKLGLAPDLASQALGIASFFGCLWCLGRLWSRTHGNHLGWPVLLLAALPAMAFHALGGLGTVSLAFLIMAWASEWQRAHAQARQPISAAICLGLACLMRAECALILPFFLYTEWRSTASLKRCLPSLLLALAPLLAWSVFRWHYYAEWLPNTYYAKHLALADELDFGLRYLWTSTLNSGIGLWLLLLIPVALGRLGDSLQRCLAQVVLVHALYVVLVGGDYIDLSRFFVPMLPLMLYGAGASLQQALGARPRLLAGVVACCAALGLWSFTDLADKKRIYEQNEGRWKLVGEQLARSFPDHLRVVISPIGCVGYLSGLPIVDPLGLVHDAMRDVQPDLAVQLKGHQRHDADWVFDQAPEVYIPSNARLVPNTKFISFLWEVDLLQHASLAANYHLEALPVEGSYPLVYYLRNDIPLPIGSTPLTPR